MSYGSNGNGEGDRGAVRERASQADEVMAMTTREDTFAHYRELEDDVAPDVETAACADGVDLLTPERVAFLIREDEGDIVALGGWIVGGHPVDGDVGHNCFDLRCAL